MMQAAPDRREIGEVEPSRGRDAACRCAPEWGEQRAVERRLGSSRHSKAGSACATLAEGGAPVKLSAPPASARP